MKTLRRVAFVGLCMMLMGAGLTLNTFFTSAEIAAPAVPAAGNAGIYADSTSHTWKVSSNGGSWFDIITSATGGTLYCLLTGCTLTGQFQDTINPASAAFADGAIIANPAACGVNEVLVGGGIAGTGKGWIDCEGDVNGNSVQVNGTGSNTIKTTQTSGTWLAMSVPSVITNAGLTAMSLDMATNVTANNNTGETGITVVTKGGNFTSGTTQSFVGFTHSPSAFGNSSGTNNTTGYSFVSNMSVITGDSLGTLREDAFRAVPPASGSIVTSGLMSGFHFVSPTTSGPAAGTLTAVEIDNLASAGAGTENAIQVGTGWDNQLALQGFNVSGTGALTISASATNTTCTLNGGSPSTCTATVTAGTKCQCTPVGATAAIAAGGCAVSLSGTTVTATSANGLTNLVNLFCP